MDDGTVRRDIESLIWQLERALEEMEPRRMVGYLAFVSGGAMGLIERITPGEPMRVCTLPEHQQ